MELFMPVLIKMLRQGRPALLLCKGKSVAGGGGLVWGSSNRQLLSHCPHARTDADR